jgi:hypothetical protein
VNKISKICVVAIILFLFCQLVPFLNHDFFFLSFKISDSLSSANKKMCADKLIFDPLTSQGLSRISWGHQQVRHIFQSPGPKSKHNIAARVLDENRQPIFKPETVEKHLRLLRKGMMVGRGKEALSGEATSLLITFFFFLIFFFPSHFC